MPYLNSAAGEGKTPAQLQKKLDEWERKYTAKELKEMCQEKGLPTSGTKRDLIHRLFAHHARTWTPEGISRVVRAPQVEKAPQEYSWEALTKLPYGAALWDIGMIGVVEQVVYMAREPKADVHKLDHVDVHWKVVAIGMDINGKRVMPIAWLCYFFPLQTIYETWMNFYGEGGELDTQKAFQMLGKQERVLLLFHDSGPIPNRVMGFANDLAYFFRGQYGMLKALPPWTDAEFMEAKQRIMDRYSTDDIWRLK